jgi:ATP-binding protein involved in chromosome partitioning
VRVPVAGIVETMGGEVFGTGGGRALADEYGLALLGEVPLDAAIREACDAGTPIAAVGTGAQRHPWEQLAGRLLDGVSAEERGRAIER